MAIPQYQANAGDVYTVADKRKHYLKRDFDVKELIDAAELHYGRVSSYQLLYNYYKGLHIILDRHFNDANKPNNKVVHNFPKLLVDTAASYLAGEPITLKGDERTIEEMLPILNKNDFHDVDAELVKMSGIYGHAFEIHYLDREGEYRIKAVSPQNMVICYSMDLDEEPLAAIYYNTVFESMTGDSYRTYEVYTKDSIIKFGTTTKKDTAAPVISDSPRYYANTLGKFNVFEVVANEERLGDFEAQIPLIDAYNLAVSDSVNDINYMNDAYLWLSGFDVEAPDPEDPDYDPTQPTELDNMKNNRILITDEGGDAKWLVKNINDTHIENIKDRAERNIFSLSQTPDLASKDFNAATGTAMKAATQPLENKSKVREVKLRKVFRQRYEIICNYLKEIKNVKGLKPEKVEPVFVRNLPQSFSELADMAVKLRDILPDETIVSQFPFITDPESEIKKANEQRKERMKIQAEMTALKQTNLGTVATAAKKLDNRTDPNTITTDDPESAKAQEKARNKPPRN